MTENHQIIASSVLDLFNSKKNLVGVELGVKFGKLSESFLTIDSSLKMYSVDLWGFHPSISEEHRHEENYKEAVKRLAPFGERSVIIRELTSDAARMFPDSFFDFVYIDATHSYEAVDNDIKLWRGKIKPDGFLCGHDYCAGWESVIEAVNCHITDFTKLKLLPLSAWGIDINYTK